MQPVEHSRNLPNPDRISVFISIILLAYVLTHLVDLPRYELATRLIGIYIVLQINIQTITPILIAGLTAAGADWLLSDHPAMQGKVQRRGSRIQHWLLPALTAWVIGIPLSQLSFGLLWWGGLVAGCTLLTLILLAEYIAIDLEDIRHPAAETGLTAVSFAMYLIIAIALRAAGLRLYLILPALTLTAGVVSLRTLHLRSGGDWDMIEAGLIALMAGQVTAALHYWPLSPTSFGLAMLGPAYALTNLVSNLAEAASLRQALVGPVSTLLVIWGAAWWMR
jgi:hypothetical protein